MFGVLKRKGDDKIIHALLLLSETLQHILHVMLGEMMSLGKMPM
jgi:hypothetical protein